MKLTKLSLILLLFLAACVEVPAGIPTDTSAPQSEQDVGGETAVVPIVPTVAEHGNPDDSITIQIDTNRDVHPISPLIYGLSGATPDHATQLNTPLNSWGGNPATRYNWEIGHAWNSGSDWFYRNGNYGITEGSASDAFFFQAKEHDMEVRLSVPTLGWVAKDDNNNTCSFPNADGTCGDANGSNCNNPSIIADPNTANVESNESSVKAWMQHLFDQGYNPRFLSMDNEPELWGVTHYDVHPDCTTYSEIMEQYVSYSTTVQQVFPDAELTGPNTCCWYFYWNSAAGDADKLRHGNQDFLPWFLDQMRTYEEENQNRILDVMDIHYYPSNVFNDDAGPEMAAMRLRSTRSLWDPTYVDESWINEPIYLVPRMKALIEEHYPGTPLGISEWNWGAEETMNGALAIADVLGIYGREDVYFAAYWRVPPIQGHAYYAFKMFTNFNSAGQRFGETSVWSATNNFDRVSGYAAVDSETGNLHVMMVNKQVTTTETVTLDIAGFEANGNATMYQYSGGGSGIIETPTSIDTANPVVVLPPYTITLLVIEPTQ